MSKKRNDQESMICLMSKLNQWLSLLHLISIFSGPQTPSGFPSAPSAGCGFPYHISSLFDWNSNTTGCRTQLNYRIWNRMFNRHQAEITVMQFRGHSLQVCQSMRVSWDFLALKKKLQFEVKYGTKQLREAPTQKMFTVYGNRAATFYKVTFCETPCEI